MKQVAVVIPHHQATLTDDELISVRHLKRHLSNYDQFLLFPDNLDAPKELSDTQTKAVSSKHFLSVLDYCLFITSLPFYDLFDDYKFILIYQLDALVFSDRLMEWCNKDYDYIGAPWYFEEDFKKESRSKYFGLVGNSGLCLRNISSCRKVLQNYNRPQKLIRRETKSFLKILKLISNNYFDAISNKYFLKNTSLNYLKKQKSLLDPRGIEDYFWAVESHKYTDRFKIPSAEIAVDFSFETSPRYCFEKNNGKLPFGCHAWTKYDRAFWEPHLLLK